MRIRQVRPEFWSDPTLAPLPDGARLFYVGLWNVADDAGWLDWNVPQLGALLYPYRDREVREQDIADWSEALTGCGRLRLLACGCGHVPTLSKHQRVTGKQSFTLRDKHFMLHGKRSPLSGSPVTERNVEERNVTSDGLSTDFDEAMARNGLSPIIGGKSA